MKRLALTAAATLLLAGSASAQSSITVTPSEPSTTGTVTIEPEVRTKVRQYVTTNRSRGIAAPSGFEVRTGAVLPESIEVQSFPSDVGVTQYRYVTIGERTALVEPRSRRIIEVIE